MAAEPCFLLESRTGNRNALSGTGHGSVLLRPGPLHPGTLQIPRFSGHLICGLRLCCVFPSAIAVRGSTSWLSTRASAIFSVALPGHAQSSWQRVSPPRKSLPSVALPIALALYHARRFGPWASRGHLALLRRLCFRFAAAAVLGRAVFCLLTLRYRVTCPLSLLSPLTTSWFSQMLDLVPPLVRCHRLRTS